MRKGFLGIDSILFRVKDLKAATKFYEEELGLKRVWEDKERSMVGLIFPDKKSEIVIHTDPSIKNPDFGFLVENVNQFCKNHKAHGYEVDTEPFEVRCGEAAVILDPDGNKLPIVDLTKFGGKPEYDI